MARTFVGSSLTRTRITDTSITIILALHLLLATWYSFAIPPWEATDEKAHFEYALFLRDQRRLPLQSQEPAKLDTVMAHHPPLYYTALALIGAPIDTSDLEMVARPNHAYSWGSSLIGGHFVVIHDEDLERFPYQGALLALHIFRLVSVLAGAVTVFAAWRIARLFVGRDHWLAPTTAAAVAFLPSFLFTSATVHNDIFVTMFGALVIWQALRIVHLRPSMRRHATLGLLLAAVVLSKLSGLIFFALPLLIAVTHAWRTRRLAVAFSGLATTFGVFLIFAGWWLARNQVLYGDPLGWSVFATNPIFPIRTVQPSIDAIIDELRPPQNLLFRTFFLAFGYMDHYGPTFIYDLAWLAVLLGIAGVVFAVIKRPTDAWRTVRASRFWLASATVILMFASLVRYMIGFNGGGHGRYLFPVLPFLALPIMLGLGSLLPRRFAPWPAYTACAGLLALAFAFQPLILTPTYAVAGRVAIDPSTSSSVAQFGDLIELLEADVAPVAVAPGETITVKFRWRALGQTDENYLVFVHLLDSESRVVAQYDATPAAGRAPTSLWKPGDAFADTVQLRIPASQTMGVFRVETGFYRRPSLERLVPNTGAPSRSVLIGTVKVRSAVERTLFGGVNLDVPFGEAIRLRQVATPATLGPGEQAQISLLWQALAYPQKDYTASIQLLDSAGRLVSQRDARPQDGSYPTSVWEPDELIPDQVVFPIPSSLQPGRYRLIVVLYDAATGQRLSTPQGDLAEIARFDVAE